MRIIKVDRKSVAYIPRQVIDFLDKSVKRSSFLCPPLQDVLLMAINGRGFIEIVMDGKEAVGVFFYTVRLMNGRKLFNLVLLGGRNVMSWRDLLAERLWGLTKELGCTDFIVMGRSGWKKIFPEINELSRTYHIDVANIQQKHQNCKKSKN